VARWMRKPCHPAEIPSKKCARKVVRASVEHARSNDPFVVLCKDLFFFHFGGHQLTYSVSE
jgi:hypothetical protein